MSAAIRIALEEWRYWSRSRLAISAVSLLVIVILASVISTASGVHSESEARRALQVAAEETFLAQPDRHPHRMVHYGHYVFRAPAPLAVIDPGVDGLTGTVMFLEGHRQNSATFPAAYTAPRVAGFNFLSPAFTYQVLVPLVLIAVGFSAVARERELQTDTQLTAQGVGTAALWLGKSLALVALSVVVLLPLAVAAALSSAFGESIATIATLVLVYLLYLGFWSFAIVGVSARSKTPALSLLWCCVAWLVVTLLVPRLASDIGNTLSPVEGKIQTDMALIEAMRAVGDGQNAADPAFESLRARILDEYGVESVEELPVNFRGIVAETAEARLTEVLNRFADERMQGEMKQARVARHGAWLSPMASVRNASMLIAGSDLGHHHRFLQEAEAARFAFVQGLNRAHINQLSYIDDINRNNGDAAWLRARVSSDNWRVLQSFDFRPAPASERIAAAAAATLLLLMWFVAAAGFAYLGLRRSTRQRYVT